MKMIETLSKCTLARWNFDEKDGDYRSCRICQHAHVCGKLNEVNTWREPLYTMSLKFNALRDDEVNRI